MRNKIVVAVLLVIGTVTFGQTNLVVIDRENITTGSTTTGNATGVSSIGFTRGPGIAATATAAANHTSSGWTTSNAADADAAGDYIEWSITALPTYSLTITDLDIRVRRNNSGPQAWQIFYSFDNFTTAGVALTNEEINPPSATNFLFDSSNAPGLPILAPLEGATITFRLYAWNSNTTAGWFRIANGSSAGWADLGISSPGARIVGTAVTSSTNSTTSDIIRSTSFNEPENIDYLLYDASSGLTTLNALQIGEFTIRDGGDSSPDSDSDPTTLTDISFSITNASSIAALAIFEGNVLVSELTSITNLIDFSNLNGGAGIVAPDDGENSFKVFATFTSDVVDNEQVQLRINSVNSPASGSSLFEFGDGGGAATSLAGDDNKIEVLGASFLYVQNTTDVNVFEPMSPGIEIWAVDSNFNLDLDYSDEVGLITSNSFDAEATTTANAVSGVITFNNLRFISTGTGETITAFATGFINTQSSVFNINNPFYTIATQDFDGSGPEWNYVSSTPFFDNGWGIEGYYDLIDIDAASPLDFPLFSGNISGENDLQDTENGNGTSGFARLTFDNVDVSGFSNVKIIFDWQVTGYSQNRNDILYRPFINGVAQTAVTLFEGNGIPTEGSGRVVIEIPDGASTVGLWIQRRNNRIAGYSGFDNFRVVSEFEGLIYRNGTWVPNAPTAGTGSDDVIISSGTYMVDSPIEVNDFIIDPNAAVEIDPGQTLLSNGTLINNGTLTLNSTSTEYSSILPTTVDDNGTNNYNRFVNVVGSGSSGGNDLVSLPLMPDTGQTFDEFIALGSPSNASKLATNSIAYAFGPFNRFTRNYENYLVTGTDELSRGIGYRAASTNGETLTFSGNIVSGDVTNVPVSKPIGGTQWNLIGNPYPSYLDSQSFLTENFSVFDPNALAIYGYNSGTNSGSGVDGVFTIVNFLTNNTVNIAPGQGFFIAVTNTEGFSGSVNFRSSMRTLTGNNDFILSRNSQSETSRIRLKLSGGNKTKFTDIYLTSNATLDLDPGYDAALFNLSQSGFELYSSIVAGSTNTPMAIQALPELNTDPLRIPIGVVTNAGQQLTFSIDELILAEDTQVILEDVTSNTYTDLKLSDYILTANQSFNGTGHFYLNLSSNRLSTVENELKDIQVFTTSPKQIHISGMLNSTTKLRVIDLQGRVVFTSALRSDVNAQQIDANSLGSGVYLVELINDQGSISTKVILN